MNPGEESEKEKREGKINYQSRRDGAPEMGCEDTRDSVRETGRESQGMRDRAKRWGVRDGACCTREWARKTGHEIGKASMAVIKGVDDRARETGREIGKSSTSIIK